MKVLSTASDTRGRKKRVFSLLLSHRVGKDMLSQAASSTVFAPFCAAESIVSAKTA